MRGRWSALLLHDVRLQWRQGFVAAYSIVILLYVLILRATPDAVHERALPALLYSDPAALGGFFIGGLVLLERGEGSIGALFVTPVRVAEYLAAKVCSLTLLALATCLSMAGFTARAPVSWPPLAVAIALTSSMIVLVGLALVSRFGTVNQYFAIISGVSLPLVVPLARTVGLGDQPWFWIFPSDPALRLIEASLAGRVTPLPELVACLAGLVFWNMLAWVWARRWFERYAIGRMRGRA